MAAQSWAGVIGSAIVTSAGLVGTVVTGRASARFAERSDLIRRLGGDLYLTSRGGLPRVRDLHDPVHAGVYAANSLALAARVALVHALGQIGPPEQALRLADEVLADCETHLSAAHPVTLNSRFEQALWTAECDTSDR